MLSSGGEKEAKKDVHKAGSSTHKAKGMRKQWEAFLTAFAPPGESICS